MRWLAADQPDLTWLIFLFLAAVLLATLSILWRVVALVIRGRVFPKTAREDILFQERFASGRFLDGPWLRRANANNCLKITVTHSELWIRSCWPFRFLDQVTGLEHRIPLARLVVAADARSSRDRIQLEFADEAGDQRRFELRLRQSRGFLDALAAATSRAQPSTRPC